MKEKPPHLTPENAARFQEQGVVDVYHLRLPHPEGVFTTLASLLPEHPRTILDVGTGDGVLARRLTAYAERVDAVDVSAPMLAKGRAAPGGDAPNLNWFHGRVEDVELQPPYGLIVGGDSIHWLDWEIAFPKFHDLLVPDGFVALVGRSEQPTPWQASLQALIERYSVYRQYRHFSLQDELVERGHFERRGEYEMPPFDNQQSVDDYVMSWYSRGGLARETMSADHIAAFDSGVRELVMPYAVDGLLTLHTVGHVAWGKPLKA
jgi:SAM-dependent methyltransferase